MIDIPIAKGVQVIGEKDDEVDVCSGQTPDGIEIEMKSVWIKKRER
jgi:hypothetical protein